MEKIDGPIVLVCGEQDQGWPSCNYATAIAERRGTHQPTVVRDANAGHYVDIAVPWLPYPAGVAGGTTLDTGGTAVADGHARAAAWPQLLAFVAAIP